MDSTGMRDNTNTTKEDNMDIKTILKQVYRGRKTIYYALAIAFVLGNMIQKLSCWLNQIAEAVLPAFSAN